MLMETTTVEDSEDQENLKALKNFRICMTQEGTPYGTWQTMKPVNTRDQGVSEKDRNMEHQNSKFCQENSKTGDINHEMKAHGSNMGIDMANDGVIARLFYCHHAELSVQMHGRIEWQNAEGASVSEGCSFNIAGTSPGSGILHQEVQEGPAEAVFGKEVFREETQEPEAEVAKLEKQNPEVPEIRHELKESRTTAQPRMLKPKSLECNSRIFKDVTRDFASIEIDLAKELEKTSMIGRSHWRHEQRLEEFGDVEDSLTFRRPNPYYIPTLDATFVSCHLFDVFSTATTKSVFSKLLLVLCAFLSLDLSYLTPNP